MTQVNLLPTEVREGQKSRRALAAVVLAVGAAVFLLLFIYTLQTARLSNANHKLAAQQALNQGLQTQINSLQQFAQLKAEVALRQTLTQQALTNQVRWSGVLRDISMVIPNQMWLTGMNAQVSESIQGPLATPGAATVVGPETLVGTIQFQGMASDNPTIALWLSRLVRVTGWENSWLTTAQKIAADPNNPGASKVQFATSVDLAYAATVQGSKK
ncbi:MAG TPA: PilN domain-containing protein [Actinomycetota bacterium]